MEIIYRELSDIKQLDGNPRKITKEQLDKLKQSISYNPEYFEARPIILSDRTGDLVVIAGNQRYKACKELGIDKAPTVLLSGLSEDKEREIIIRDNVNNGEWDESLLADWDKDELKEWGVDLPDWKEEIKPVKAEEDSFTEEDAENVETRVKTGEIWQLGEHRLMCGDSTKVEDVERLMDGERADMVFTDPPYGVDIVKGSHVGGDKSFGSVGGGKIVKAKTYMAIKGDETTETARLNYEIIKEISKEQIIFGGNYFTDFLPPKACWVIWDKQNTGNFADVELAWTSMDKGAKLYKWLWNGLCRKGDRSIEGKTRVRPTQKPVGLIADILNDFTKENEIILDCFGGSGSTLIACEQINRSCRMIEYESYYCDVIIERWEKLTGKEAVKIYG